MQSLATHVRTSIQTGSKMRGAPSAQRTSGTDVNPCDDSERIEGDNVLAAIRQNTDGDENPPGEGAVESEVTSQDLQGNDDTILIEEQD